MKINALQRLILEEDGPSSLRLGGGARPTRPLRGDVPADNKILVL